MNAADQTPPSDAAGSPTGQTPFAQPPNRRIPARRRWLFRGMAILVGILPFVLLEFGLWLCGFGDDLRLIAPVKDSPGWFRFNPRFDEAFYGAIDLSGPEERPFRLPKPERTFRIVVVGGSTVIGFPYAPDLAFPRQLEVLLDNDDRKDTTFEVLNAGITALNSSSEVVVVEEALACDPDLLIVYTGHNEFYGPNGAAAIGGKSPTWFRFLARMQRFRLVQLLRRLAPPTRLPPSSTNLFEHFTTQVDISKSSRVFQTAEQRLEQNLELMISSARSRGVPLILAGPACNERHQAPIEPALPERKQPGEPAWHQTVREAERELRFDHPELALPLLESAAGDFDAAIVEFRLAQALDRLGRLEEAAPHYRRARDLDGVRYRAPSSFTEIFRRAAAEHADDRVYFVDLQRALEEVDLSGIVGRRHFLEHVHFTWEGNAAVASALARFAARRRLVPMADTAEFSTARPGERADGATGRAPRRPACGSDGLSDAPLQQRRRCGPVRQAVDGGSVLGHTGAPGRSQGVIRSAFDSRTGRRSDGELDPTRGSGRRIRLA